MTKIQLDCNDMRVKQKRKSLNRRRFLCANLAASDFLLAGPSEGSELVVEVTYAGSGTVDASHKVYVVLWDSPELPREGSHVSPLQIKSVSVKSSAVRFKGIKSNSVYVSAVYDPTGQWDAKSAPPSGAALGLYGKKRHTPDPIQVSAQKTTTISLTFPNPSKASI